MKKSVKTVLLLLVLFSFQVVKAADEATSCEYLSLNAVPGIFDASTNYIMYYNNNGTNSQSNYAIYTLTGEGGKNYVAYCRNAGKCATNDCVSSITTTQPFTCSKKVFDPNIEATTPAEKAVKAYEKGIVEILQKGYKNDGADTYENYIIANIALRTFEMMWVNESTNGTNDGHRLNKVMKYYTNIWLNDITVQELATKVNTLLGKNSVKMNAYTSVNELISWNGDPTLTKNIQDAAYNLVKQAFNVSIKYLEEGAASLTWNKDPLKTKKPTTVRDGVSYYEVSHTYNFKVENFTSSRPSIKMQFECADCDRYNLDYEIYINDSNHNRKYTDISNLEFLNFVSNGNGDIKLDIVFKGNSNDYHCEEINYKLNIKYYDDTISTEAYVMKDADCPTCQWFYMLYSDDVEKVANIENTAELCILTCKDAEAQCAADPNSPACDVFYGTYGGNCAECTTYIENAECDGPEDNNISINEGYDVDTSNCGTITDDNLNVLQCIINAKDPADNSYQALTNSNGEFSKVQKSTNDYCTVWCKENYHFTLPGEKESNSGRYFSLKTSIQGAKTCYTSEIKTEQFKEDVESARIEVIKAWNKWNKLYTGYNYGKNDSYEQRHSYYECGSCCEDCSGCCPHCEVEKEVTRWKRSWEYVSYSFTGEDSEKIKYTYYRDDGEAPSCYYCDCDGNDGSTYAIMENLKDDIDEASGVLEEKIKNYSNIINQYNSCYGDETYEYEDFSLNKESTIGWIMEYNYNPTIKFWYEESYMESVIEEKLDTVGNITIDDRIEIHYPIVDKKYENDQELSENEQFKNLSTVLPTGNFVCYESSEDYYDCSSTLDILVGMAKYVKQEMTVEAKYITPTQFYTIYPTGAIVVAPPGQEDQIENSQELTNLLPVGLGTRQGVYNYSLKIENLGEYYNKKDKLGRLWGDSDSVVVKVLEDAENGNSCTKEGALTTIEPETGASMNDASYVCAYKVNCPDCPVECDPVCKNPDCPDNSCPVECDNCIYTNSSTNIGYKPITPGNINPNDREMGVNWNYNENSISTALELKAYATTTEIEKAGETIYDIDYEDTTTSVDTEFAMQVKLDTQMINLIRTYNDQYENGDGYANNTLKCYDYKNSSDGKTYDNIYCYSTFIDHIIEETGGPNTTGGSEKVKIVGGTRIFNEGERTPERIFNSGYWTTWSQANASSWTVTTQSGIAYYQKNYKEIGIGPSWK